MKKLSIILPFLVVSAAMAQNGNAYGHARVDTALKHDTSLALRDIKPIAPQPGLNREKPEPKRIFKNDGLASDAADPVRQSAVTALNTPAVLTTFEGNGDNAYGYSVKYAPPDTNGSIGRRFTGTDNKAHQYYVQWVNDVFAVFDVAQNNALVYGPAAGNTLWSGFGGGCEANNDGDPIVLYDKMADRWVMTQFSVSTTPYMQCVAVSKTADPTGQYNRYSFSYGSLFNDYPKVGVWPDGYYVTYNMFSGNSWHGGEVCAWDRAKMLSGAAATQQCFDLGSAHGGMLTSDLDGATLPPAGEPNYLMEFGTNVLNVWKFHVDWTTPANTTLSGPTSLAVAAFSQACGGGTCIPQAGTRQQLDSLGDRLMYRLAYRYNAATATGSMLVNHSVQVSTGKRTSNTAVRWYELKTQGGTVSVKQQGTYSPDTASRWMGSMAADKVGNIFLGYSKSSSSMNPAIFYTMRAPSDAVGTMQGEVSMYNGTGSQLRNLARWGDYASLSVDPTDDCTLWFTSEYLNSDGTWNWHTHIGSMKASTCQ